jgi:FtsP/CotA-like multicopper oxidase with cupredoxin domain
MSRNQRIGLIVLALVVAVAGFLIARPDDDEEEGSSSGAQPAQTETADGSQTTPETAPGPRVARIALRGGAPSGGVRSITVEAGEAVRIVVTSDAPDEVHLHGYDIRRRPGPGKPARFAFRARIEGVFEIESHVAEDAGREPLIARLVVEPA